MNKELLIKRIWELKEKRNKLFFTDREKHFKVNDEIKKLYKELDRLNKKEC